MNESSNEPIDEGEFTRAWKSFVGAAKRLLSGVPKERALDPFLSLRDSVLQAAESSQITEALQVAWSKLHEPNGSPEVAHLVLVEVIAVPAAVDIAEAEEKADKTPSLSKKRLAGIGQTTVDSIRDILTDLPPLVKAILKVLSEVFDVFWGD